jgi:hypothetical protein
VIRDLAARNVLASFDNRIAAEIACALLADASLRSDEPEAARDGSWRIALRDVSPDLSARAEVILRSARARETLVVPDEPQRAG